LLKEMDFLISDQDEKLHKIKIEMENFVKPTEPKDSNNSRWGSPDAIIKRSLN
jgi:hypothetical protein